MTSIAAAIGRSEGAVRKWLRGQAEPNATDLRLLSTATGASVDWLIFGGDTEFSASVVKTYLAYMSHRRDCDALQRDAAVWTELSAAQRRVFERRALVELADWVIADATPAFPASGSFSSDFGIGGPLQRPVARRIRSGSVGGPQLRKSGGPELRKSGGTQLGKSGGSQPRKFCTSDESDVASSTL